ncbi:excalibur calcium-binding domain-containing protein [Streptomyces sp. PR69]|uniref:excalibur calcium-binding domain-containing protein n=1 Tax=Streptomyces sp. PR69 TaxID=2984950 RepID=UPI002264DDC5|nr:excalibur calcium-binding domain-containing protein [Streptomyces sp. PR69]
MNRLLWLAPALLIALIVGVTGCGDGDPDRPADSPADTPAATPAPTVTATVTVPASPPASPPTPPPEESESPADTVRRYYAAINARDYRQAWELGGKNLSPSYETFVAGFATTARDTLHVQEVTGDVVRILLEAVQTDGSLRLFEGTYTVRDGVIVSASVRELTVPSPYYENCDAARAAGAAPLYRGEPGYGPHLDADDDGVACEPYVP